MKDYRVAHSTSHLADLMGWDGATLATHLAQARGHAHEDIWDAVMGAAAQASTWYGFCQADRAGQVLRGLELPAHQGHSVWHTCPDYLMQAEALRQKDNSTGAVSLLHDLARNAPLVLLGATAQAQQALAQSLWNLPRPPGIGAPQEWGRQHLLVFNAIPSDTPMVPGLQRIHVVAQALFETTMSPSLVRTAVHRGEGTA